MSRYIDADALKKTFNEFPCLWVQYTIAGHTDKDIENIVDDVLTQAKQTIISEINEQPTADVVKVVHGEWIDKGEDYVIRWSCSNCGRKDTHIYNFCPDCGADMRGESK